MGGPRRSRSGRMRDGLVWGLLLGAASGAVLGGAIDGLGPWLGAVIGAAVMAPLEAVGSRHRPPALWRRILASALLMAIFGCLLGLIWDEPLFIGLTSGALLGL